MRSTTCIICTNPREVKKSPKGDSKDQNNFRMKLDKIWPIFLKYFSLPASAYEEILKYYTKIDEIPFCVQHQNQVEQVFILNKQIEEINDRIKNVTTKLSASIIESSSTSLSPGVTLNQNLQHQKAENCIKRNLRKGESSAITAQNTLKLSSNIPDKQVQNKIKNLRRTITECYLPTIYLQDCQKDPPKLLNHTYLPAKEENEKKVQNDSKISDLKNTDFADKQLMNDDEVVKCIQNEDIKSCNLDKNNEIVPPASTSKDEEEEEEEEEFENYDDDDDDDDPGFVLTNIQLNINQNVVQCSPKHKNEGIGENKIMSNINHHSQDDNQKCLNNDNRLESPTSKIIHSNEDLAAPDTHDSVEKNSFKCYMDDCEKSFKLKRGLMSHLIKGHKLKHVGESLLKSANEDVGTKINLSPQNDNSQDSPCVNDGEEEVQILSDSPNSGNCTVTSTSAVPSVIVVNKNYKNPKMKENEKCQEDTLLEIDPRVSLDSEGIFHYGRHKYVYLKNENKMRCFKCGSNQNNHEQIIRHIDMNHEPRIYTFSPMKNIDLEKLEEYALLTDPSTSIPTSPLLLSDQEAEQSDEAGFEKQQQQQQAPRRKAGRKKKQEFVCEIENCGKTLRSQFALLMHQKAGHSVQSLACPAPECPKRFIKENLLELHVQAAHGELSKAPNFSLQSTNSSKIINLSSSFNLTKSSPASSSSNNNTNSENTAVATSTTTSNTRNSQNTTTSSTFTIVDGKRIWKCEDCPKEYQSYVGIYLHRKASHEEIDNNKFFSCPLCSQNFTRKVMLNRHLKTHDLLHLKKVLPCELCKLSFASSASLSKHIASNHSILGRVKGAGGRDRVQESVHLNEHAQSKAFERGRKKKSNNSDRTKIFKCLETNCGKLLASASSLSLHKRIHAGIRPFKCPVCSSSHVQKNHLKSHIDNHHPGVQMPKLQRFSFQKALSSTRTPTFVNHYSSPRPTVGGGVNRQISWNSSSSTIKRFKPGPKPKKVLSNSRPIIHQPQQGGRQTHNRVSSVLWTCDFPNCNKEFSSYIALYSHKRSHSKTIIACSERNCTMTFTQKSDFQTHLMYRHPKPSSSGVTSVITSSINRNSELLNDNVLRLDMNEPDCDLAEEEQDIFEIEYDYDDEDYVPPSFF